MYGSKPDGTPLAAWWVINQKDTFYGGPVRTQDLQPQASSHPYIDTRGLNGGRNHLVSNKVTAALMPEAEHVQTSNKYSTG